MQLEQILRQRKKEKDLLLMTHIVLGYPSLATNREVIRQMIASGVDCIEMQIPFSEPMADGPVIVKANQDSLANGTTVSQCLAFAAEMTATHDIPFLFMTYYNILYKHGEERFFADARQAGIRGLIIPDLPPEMSPQFFQLAKESDIAPIPIYAPTSTPERMATLDSFAQGFIYCMARRGVTGTKSSFDDEFTTYLNRCRQSTRLPIAVGFGIQDRQDIDSIRGHADMAVIGSQTIRLVDAKGAEAVGPFIRQLHNPAQP
ncbi:MAG: tryptophan synthase subunit alpha [Desulfopila sp.]